MAYLFTAGRFVDSRAAGGTLETYAAGTLTPLATYTTQAGNVSNPTTITLDAEGSASVWLGSAAYRMIVKDSDGVTISDDDNIRAPAAEVVAMFSASTGSASVGFIQDGTGAVARTAQDKMRETVSPDDYKLDTDPDDTLSFTRALAYVGNDGCIELAGRTYVISSRIDVTQQRLRITGKGRGATRVRFAPTANGALFRFGTTGGGVTYMQTLEHLTITSDDSTYEKTAVELYDTSTFVIRDVEITSSVSASGTLTWTGGASGSIGIRTYGREAPRFQGGVYISADNPIRISRNVNTFSPQVDADFFSLIDVYMIANSKPVVLIDGDVELTNFMMVGCPLVRGTSAIRWVGTSATRSALSFVVRNCRHEQPQDATAYSIDIQPNQNLYNFNVEGFSISDGVNAVRLRNCVNPSLRGVVYSDTGGRVALNIDSTVVGMKWDDCFWGTNATVSLTGQRLVWAMPRVLSSDILPRTAQYDQSANTRSGVKYAGGLEGYGVTLADDATYTIGGVNTRGWLFIVDSEAVGAQFFLRGSSGVATEVSDPYSVFANSDLDTYNCVYWDSGSSSYILKNRRGASRTYYLTLVGSFASLEAT